MYDGKTKQEKIFYVENKKKKKNKRKIKKKQRV